MDQGHGANYKHEVGIGEVLCPVSILYLDDDPQDRRLLELSLGKVDSKLFELICVATVDEARAVLSSRSVDFFVSDNRLHPTTTFRDTLASLEDLTIDGKIIIVSGETESILTAEYADLVHAPDMIRNKLSFFSDVRKTGLDALEDPASLACGRNLGLPESGDAGPAGLLRLM